MLHFVPLERPTTLDHRTKRVAGVSEVIKFLKGILSIQVSGACWRAGGRASRHWHCLSLSKIPPVCL